MAEQDTVNRALYTTEDMALEPLSDKGVDLIQIQESIEKHYIRQALQKTNGNESKAARLLNINHHTFRYRKKKLQIY
jgi:two-component system, NtrC family, response regulator AtoC